MTFLENSRIIASDEQVSSDLEGDTVILNFQDGMYYELSAVGVLVWKLIEEPRTLAELQVAIMEEYEVDSQQCREDLEALVDTLISKGLAEVRPE